VRSFQQDIIEMHGREWAETRAPWYACMSILASNDVPTEYRWLAAKIVLMGFEHYPMPEAEWHVLCRHFLDQGVRIPDTPYKILVSGANRIEFGQSDGTEPELPHEWLQYVTADGSTAAREWHFLGKRIAALKGWDTADHTETADGWVLDRPRELAGVQSAPAGTT
jgi:hypothetical protein